MQIVESLFGIIFLMGIIACAFAGMFSAHHGMAISKRIGLSLLMFLIASMLVPKPGTSLFAGAVQILLAFVLMLAAIITIISTHAAARLSQIVSLFGIAGVLLAIGITQLWATYAGCILLIIVLIVVLILLRRRAHH